MKRLTQRQWAARVAGLVFAGAASGCTSTYYRHTREITEVYRISLLQGVDMRCTARPSGEIVLERYINDGGGAQAGAAVGAGLKAAGGL